MKQGQEHQKHIDPLSIKKIIIAIDGYSSCGKSTLAKALASKLGYTYIDSGAMYRCVTYYSLNNDIIIGDEINKEKLIENLPNITITFEYNPALKYSEAYLNGIKVENEIRTMHVSNYVSAVSAIKEVRKKMIDLQKEFGKNKGVVMDGRDIGTAVFPNAHLKLFMTADVEVRTQRRLDELTSKGILITAKEVSDNLNKRDYEDTHRKENPLTKAKDAILFDNSDLGQTQQLDYILKIISDFEIVAEH